MRVIIVGCGQVGTALASQLYKMGHKVIVIDQDEKAFNHLPEDFQGRTIPGDVMAKEVLRRAEVNRADAFFALTKSDPLNALIAYVVQKEFGVKRVAARNNDPRQMALQTAFGIPVFGPSGWEPENIANLLDGEPIHAVHLDHQADLIIYKIIIPSKWANMPMKSLFPAGSVYIIRWSRSSKNLTPEDDSPLQEGDQIFISGEGEAVQRIRELMDVKLEHKR
jgi:trk system potassium uptake protein TrkA